MLRIHKDASNTEIMDALNHIVSEYLWDYVNDGDTVKDILGDIFGYLSPEDKKEAQKDLDFYLDINNEDKIELEEVG